MKGIVFTEFIEMMEDKHGFGVANAVIDRSGVSSGGVYSSIGNYKAQELMSMMEALAAITGTSESDVSVEYGEFLFERFYILYPHFFGDIKSPFDLFEILDSHVHTEVRKLYPDAELPGFTHERVDLHTMKLLYESSRRMHDFAYGLILGSLKHFNCEGLIEMAHIDDTRVLFTIRILDNE